MAGPGTDRDGVWAVGDTACAVTTEAEQAPFRLRRRALGAPPTSDWRAVGSIGVVIDQRGRQTIVLEALVERTNALRLRVQVATIESHGLASSKMRAT